MSGKKSKSGPKIKGGLKSIEVNNKFKFEEDPELGMEFVKIFLDPTVGRVGIHPIVHPNANKILPQEWINHVMQGIGKLFIDSFGALELKRDGEEIPVAKK